MTHDPIPDEFDPSGQLAPGTYVATLRELGSSLLVSGSPSGSFEWDGPRRSYLVSQLEVLVGELWQVGIDRIFIDGSFCTDKPRPGDIDGYFVTGFPNWPAQAAQLRALRAAWTWDPHAMRPAAGGKPKLPMWHDHRVELYPVFDPPFRAQSFRGAQSVRGPVFIDEFFRLTRDHLPKGIVQIAREAAP